MKTFNQFINEGIRDLMTGKPKEGIRKSFVNTPLDHKLVSAVRNNLLWLVEETIE